MKKLALLILTLALFCKKPANQAGGPLDANSLKQSTWEGIGDYQTTVITFDDKNMKFEIQSGDQACGIAGYSIQDGKIQTATTTKCPEGGHEYGQRAMTCNYLADDSALDYKVMLHCDDFRAGRKNSKVGAGVLVKINNNEFISAGWVGAQLRETTVFRSEPDTKAKEVTIETKGVMTGPASSEGGTKATTLKQGETVTLIARTKDKHKVQNWENYWYYVEFSGAQRYRGWIFGEFVTLN